jgi:hypothetical protein
VERLGGDPAVTSSPILGLSPYPLPPCPPTEPSPLHLQTRLRSPRPVVPCSAALPVGLFFVSVYLSRSRAEEDARPLFKAPSTRALSFCFTLSFQRLLCPDTSLTIICQPHPTPPIQPPTPLLHPHPPPTYGPGFGSLNANRENWYIGTFMDGQTRNHSHVDRRCRGGGAVRHLVQGPY